jgi:S-DNA-T family DNA segregation ATPase FtsK/SpoIIIE
MTRARTPSRTRTPRRKQATAAPFDPFTWLAKLLLQWQTFAALAVAALALIAVAMWSEVGGVLGRAQEMLVRTFGAGLVFVAVGLVTAAFAVYFRRIPTSPRGLLRVAGGLALIVFIWGIAGWPRPGWSIGSVSLSDVTLGGDVGYFFGHTLTGLLIWFWCGVAAAFILAPRATRKVLNAVPPAARRVHSWRVPQRTFQMVVEGAGALFSLREPDSPHRAPAGTMPYPPHEATGEPEDVAIVPPSADVPSRVTPKSRSAAAGRAATDDGSLPAVPSGTNGWQHPPVDLLTPPPAVDALVPDTDQRAKLIVQTLASFGVDARVVSVNRGPTVTQFGVEPGWEVKYRTVVERDPTGRPVLDKDGKPKTHHEEVSRTRVRVNQVLRLTNDLALALAAPSVRIEAPVPGKPIIGIEVPNTNAAVVSLRSVIESPAFQKQMAKSRLALALGKGVSGEPVVADLGKMPHLLIAGATGSGKSVCINAIITCLLMHATPEEIRFVMIDPKRVELAPFADIPHLALSRVIVDMDEVVGTLGAVIHEMEARYTKFAQLAVRNLEGYNKHPKVVNKLPYWVVIIDELADLMMAAPFEVEKQICRLAQLARATGIHLVVATQRPSVDVITGLIKANFPTRIAFAVTSQVDSRTILDSAGAEKLLGRGDMLYMPTDEAKPRRLQGVYVSDAEIERLVDFWTSERFRNLKPETYDHLVEEARAEQEVEEEEDDPLLEKARALAAEHTRVSTSMLQRRLRIGYPRAARLMDILEAEGLVGAAEGLGSREVLSDSEDSQG